MTKIEGVCPVCSQTVLSIEWIDGKQVTKQSGCEHEPTFDLVAMISALGPAPAEDFYLGGLMMGVINVPMAEMACRKVAYKPHEVNHELL